MNKKRVIIRLAVELLFEDDTKTIINNKIWNYAEEIVPSYSDKQFQRHFRVTPTTFENILSKMCRIREENNSTGGNPETTLEKQLLICVWYLANIESFRGVADRFGVSVSTAWSSVYKVCNNLLQVNSLHEIISLPNVDRYNEIMHRIRERTGFPGVVGMIDGSHIPIKAPKENRCAYINRKGFHSVLLQGICDDNKIFIDCYAGEVGSVHDACMFRRSDIGRQMNDLDIPHDGHFIGDSAYPLTSKMIVPFKDNGHLTVAQRHFNNVLSTIRVTIRSTFALLEGRFRRLKLLEAVRPDMIPLIIMAACILHNICQRGNDVLQDINLEAEVAEERLMNVNDDRENVETINPNAAAKRNEIVNLLYIRMQAN